MTYKQRRALTAYAFLLPAILYFLVFFFWPIAIEFWASLRSGQPLIGESEFAGLKNYIYIFKDRLAIKAMGATLIYAVGSTVFTLLIALVLASILAGPLKARNTIRAILFFPYIVSFVISALMWKSILDPYTGLLNAALLKLGLPQQYWLTDPDAAIWVLVAVSVWKDIGYAVLIYIAAIQGIPNHLYQAAELDGAKRRHLFRDITLPLLMPTTLFLAVIVMIASMQEMALPYLMTGGGPANATRLYSLHVFDTAFQGLNIGYASALSFVMFLVILFITWAQFKLLNRDIRHT
ncbi:carbohydrate ABC transporter permease [Oceaniglobus ichthyenteri]|uniref:carbohydrate ABC transporter permease n=1 Tax=Oceaniglobus ichthyenteri TaxID=2136177 RepID=UPI000D379CD6|nr:sugar ABC transporter permease [Oceaniglobus ichthyenteri]